MGFVVAKPGDLLKELNPIRYRGYYYDTETGYYFLQTRYYNPQWRRFINADSLFIAGDDVLNGSNMYAYCNGNPVMYCDPSGMGPILDFLSGFVSQVQDLIDDLMGARGQIGMFFGWASDLLFTLSRGFEAFEKIAVNLTPFVEGISRGADWFASLFPKPSEDDTSLGGALLGVISLLPGMMNGFEGIYRFNSGVLGVMKFLTHTAGSFFNIIATWLGGSDTSGMSFNNLIIPLAHPIKTLKNREKRRIMEEERGADE